LNTQKRHIKISATGTSTCNSY